MLIENAHTWTVATTLINISNYIEIRFYCNLLEFCCSYYFAFIIQTEKAQRKFLTIVYLNQISIYRDVALIRQIGKQYSWSVFAIKHINKVVHSSFRILNYKISPREKEIRKRQNTVLQNFPYFMGRSVHCYIKAFLKQALKLRGALFNNLFPFPARFIKIIHIFDISFISGDRSNYLSFVCLSQSRLIGRCMNWKRCRICKELKAIKQARNIAGITFTLNHWGMIPLLTFFSIHKSGPWEPASFIIYNLKNWLCSMTLLKIVTFILNCWSNSNGTTGDSAAEQKNSTKYCMHARLNDSDRMLQQMYNLKLYFNGYFDWFYLLVQKIYELSTNSTI